MYLFYYIVSVLLGLNNLITVNAVLAILEQGTRTRRPLTTMLTYPTARKCPPPQTPITRERRGSLWPYPIGRLATTV